MRKLQRGETLEGRYTIEKLLASGGQAHVYRGRHAVLDRPVAIKLLRPGFSDEVSVRMAKRFEQEARLISGLRDPHTITLYDFGRLESGSLFMVFEFIDGMSLKEVLAEQGALAPHRVAKILRQTLSSLHEAHSFGVLHRDIKPANIMLFEHAGRPDQVKLLDFGIAKILRENDEAVYESLTGANNLVGTPRYIAPESYQAGVELGPPADVYSLGLVAYELLVGEPAIKGNTAVDVFRSHLSPHSVKLPPNLKIPGALRAIVNKMLEKELTARYVTCEHVLWELRDWQQDKLGGVSSAAAVSARAQDAFDPEDIAIPDPYDDVAPTQSISSKVLADLALPFVSVEPVSEAQAITPDLADSSERFSRDFMRQSDAHRIVRTTPIGGQPQALSAPLPASQPPPKKLTPDDTPLPHAHSTRDDLEEPLSPPTQVLNPDKVREALAAGEARTQILKNVPHINELLLGVAEVTRAEHKALPNIEESTQQVQLTAALREDLRLAMSRTEVSEASETALDDLDRGSPDEMTMHLKELPPLKSAAVLKRRPRRPTHPDHNKG